MKRAIVTAAGLVVAWSAVACATEPFAKIRTPITTVNYMRTVRSAGMGGTGAADPSSAANAFLNPANVIGVGGASVWYQYDDSIDFIDIDFHANDGGLSYASPIPEANGWRWGGALGYHRRSQHLDNVRVRTIFLPGGTDRSVDVDQHVTSGSGALARVQGPFTLVLAMTGRYLSLDGLSYDGTDLRVESGAITGWVWDVGARADWRWEGPQGDEAAFHGGVVWRNLDHGFDDQGIDGYVANEWRFGLGADYRVFRGGTQPLTKRTVSVVSLALDADLVTREYYDRTGEAMGVEVGLLEMVYLRGGGVSHVVGFSDGGTWGAGLALDFGVVRTRFDVSGYPLDNSMGDKDTVAYGVTLDYLR